MRHPKRLIAVALLLLPMLAVFELTGFGNHLSLEFLQQSMRSRLARRLPSFVLGFALANLAQITGWVSLAAAVLARGQV